MNRSYNFFLGNRKGFSSKRQKEGSFFDFWERKRGKNTTVAYNHLASEMKPTAEDLILVILHKRISQTTRKAVEFFKTNHIPVFPLPSYCCSSISLKNTLSMFCCKRHLRFGA